MDSVRLERWEREREKEIISSPMKHVTGILDVSLRNESDRAVLETCSCWHDQMNVTHAFAFLFLLPPDRVENNKMMGRDRVNGEEGWNRIDFTSFQTWTSTTSAFPLFSFLSLFSLFALLFILFLYLRRFLPFSTSLFTSRTFTRLAQFHSQHIHSLRYRLP